MNRIWRKVVRGDPADPADHYNDCHWLGIILDFSIHWLIVSRWLHLGSDSQDASVTWWLSKDCYRGDCLLMGPSFTPSSGSPVWISCLIFHNLAMVKRKISLVGSIALVVRSGASYWPVAQHRFGKTQNLHSNATGVDGEIKIRWLYSTGRGLWCVFLGISELFP